MNVNNKFVLNFKQDSIHPTISYILVVHFFSDWKPELALSHQTQSAEKGPDPAHWGALLQIKGEILLLPFSAAVLHPLWKHPTPGLVGFSVEGIAQQEPGKAWNYVAFLALPDSPGNCSRPPELGFFSAELLLKLRVIIKSAGELFVTESCSQSQTRTNCLACCAI